MKFKNTKAKKIFKKAKPKKTQKFPSIYRIIPEKLNKDETVFFVGLVAILAAILILSFDSYSNFNKQNNLIDKKSKILTELAFWRNEAKIHPNYRDAYFNLAVLNFQLKNFEESQKNLNKAFELDPNFEKGRELEKLLNNF